MLSNFLRQVSEASAAAQTYIEDVFSAYTYTGNSGTQTITNGVNLSANGGLVWIKLRDTTTGNHNLIDTARGVNSFLYTSTTGAAANDPGTFTSFNTTGFTQNNSYGELNASGRGYISWTFRKASKFFDVVTWTGTGASNRAIAHSLGQTPGMIIVKGYSSGVTGQPADWNVWHKNAIYSGLTANQSYLQLNTTSQVQSNGSNYDIWGSSNHTATHFYVGGSIGNQNTTTYVAYLFAHDTDATGLIQCGTFTTDGSGNATVTLGWEPQYLLWKSSSASGNWSVFDTMRGWNQSASDAWLGPNLSSAESPSDYGTPVSTGFTAQAATSTTYIYMAIRRGPMRQPTSGTQVFYSTSYAGNSDGSGNQTITSNIAFADTALITRLSGGVGGSGGAGAHGGTLFIDRLRNATYSPHLYIAEYNGYAGGELSVGSMGFSFQISKFLLQGVTAGQLIEYDTNAQNQTYILRVLRRFPKVYDHVCYAGTGSTRTVAHNLIVVPELIFVKDRAAAAFNYGWQSSSWAVYHGDNAKRLVLNTTAASSTSSTSWNNTSPTSSVFTVGSATETNGSSKNYSAYLFATLAGISKVGSYTGNGTNQTINCGFSAGARFILIKRTDSTGDWYYWDSTRGIIAGNDPHLSMNTTVAEVTTDDSVDPTNAGFIVNQDAATNINVNAATYIFLAFA